MISLRRKLSELLRGWSVEVSAENGLLDQEYVRVRLFDCVDHVWERAGQVIFMLHGSRTIISGFCTSNHETVEFGSLAVQNAKQNVQYRVYPILNLVSGLCCYLARSPCPVFYSLLFAGNLQFYIYTCLCLPRKKRSWHHHERY